MRMVERRDTGLPPFDPGGYARVLRGISILRPWFAPTLDGAENIPREEGALIVTNHGHLGMDLPIFLSLVLDATGRPVRALGDRLVFAAPFFRELAHRMGALEGEPEAAVQLLRDDQLVLVYPGGAREALRDPEQAYRLKWDNSQGFVRTALQAQKPILPVASIGNEELYLQVVSQERVRESGIGRLVSKLFGDKYVFPLYVGLGPLPFPSDLHYVVGDPIRLPYGPEAAQDAETVAAVHRQVTEATQALIDEGLRQRGRAATDTGSDTGTDADADGETASAGFPPHQP